MARKLSKSDNLKLVAKEMQRRESNKKAPTPRKGTAVAKRKTTSPAKIGPGTAVAKRKTTSPAKIGPGTAVAKRSSTALTVPQKKAITLAFNEGKGLAGATKAAKSVAKGTGKRLLGGALGLAGIGLLVKDFWDGMSKPGQGTPAETVGKALDKSTKKKAPAKKLKPITGGKTVKAPPKAKTTSAKTDKPKATPKAKKKDPNWSKGGNAKTEYWTTAGYQSGKDMDGEDEVYADKKGGKIKNAPTKKNKGKKKKKFVFGKYAEGGLISSGRSYTGYGAARRG
jgi:hypothetical protein